MAHVVHEPADGSPWAIALTSPQAIKCGGAEDEAQINPALQQKLSFEGVY